MKAEGPRICFICVDHVGVEILGNDGEWGTCGKTDDCKGEGDEEKG